MSNFDLVIIHYESEDICNRNFRNCRMERFKINFSFETKGFRKTADTKPKSNKMDHLTPDNTTGFHI